MKQDPQIRTDRHGIEPEVEHDRRTERFVYRDRSGSAILHYRIGGPRIVIESLDVAEPLSGRGIADLLVSAAIDWARSNGWAVTPVCPHARRWLLARPELWTELSIDWHYVLAAMPEAPSKFDPRW